MQLTGRRSLQWLCICLLFVATAAATGPGATGVYYCLEDYKAIGAPLREVLIEPAPQTAASALKRTANSTAGLTSGQVARQCAAACDAETDCSGFRAVGPEVLGGGTCELLTNSTKALLAALAFNPEAPWPAVNANLTAADNNQLRSISWMCWRQQQDWDAFGQATHNMITAGQVDVGGDGAAPPDHSDWCAFGVDVAGTNLRRDFENITHPRQCDDICRSNATGCTFWIFVASRPEQQQFQPARNCFAKADAFMGQNGWVGKPKSDIWIADSQVTCFNNLQDWRHLGLVLSPSIKTMQYAGSYYTVYPERVTWSEAAATCHQLSQGQLAVLDSQALLDAVAWDLLATIPFQTAVRSAWVGATGNNTAYNPAAPKLSDISNGSLQASLPPIAQPAVPTEQTLQWAGGQGVAPGLLRRPSTLTQLWTVHDVVWGQQYVPESTQDVCGRVMTQLPPSTGPVNPASVLPGVWYYDCDKPAAFICQSSAVPSEPMSGREVTSPDQGAASSSSKGSDGGGGSNFQPWKTALAVILPVLLMALLAYQVVHVYSRKMSRLPELIRQQRKRALGQPRTGRMSLVMTDIQGFTKLMQGDADQTTQALLLHNTVIKHAVYDNVGWVIEQEGDSFSVVFHDAEDAVAFTLQVQQALLQQSWPPAVTYADDWEGAADLLDCTSLPQAVQRDQQAGSTPGDLPKAASAAAAAASIDADSSPGSPCPSLMCQERRHLSSSEPLMKVAGTPSGTGSTAGCTFPVAVAEVSQGSCSSLGGWGSPLRLQSGGRSSSFTAAAAAAATGVVTPATPASRRSNSFDNTAPQMYQQQHLAVVERSAETGEPLTAGTPLRSQPNPTSAQPASASSTHRESSSIWPWVRSSSPVDISLTAANAAPSFAVSNTAVSAVAEPAAAITSPAVSSSRKSVVGSKPRNLLQQLLGPKQDQQVLFSGLRVRMGVVTGEVMRGQEVKSSDLYRRAQDVSCAAAGGQVLLDAATFSCIKEALWRLGAVGPDGLDEDALLASKSAKRVSSSSSRGGCVEGDGCLPRIMSAGSLRRDLDTMSSSGPSPSAVGSNLAIALDMGCYEVISTPLQPTYPAINSSVNARSTNTSRGNSFCLTVAPSQGSTAAAVLAGVRYGGGTPSVALWTRELGDRLVQQYQQYIQQQLTQQDSMTGDEDRDNSFDESSPYMVHMHAALQQQQQQRLDGLYPHHHTHHNHHQQQQGLPHSGLSSRHPSLSARSHVSSSSKAAGVRRSGGSADMLTKHQQQQQHLGLVGQSAMTVPGAWQQIASSLFGVRLVPAAAMGPSTGSPSEGQSSAGKPDRGDLTGYCSISAVLHPSLRLYQVLPPSLAARAALYGTALDLPHNWRLLDQPYFAAPGLSAASVLSAQQAQETAAAAVAGCDGGVTQQQQQQQQQQQRMRFLRRDSSEAGPWQQQLLGRSPGRSSSEVYPLALQQQLNAQLQLRTSSAHGNALMSAPKQQAVPQTVPQAVPQAGSPAVQGALAAAIQRQQQQQQDQQALPSSPVSRLNSSSTRTQQQQQQVLPYSPNTLASPPPPAAAAAAAVGLSQSLLLLRAASLQLNITATSTLLASGGASSSSGDRRAGASGSSPRSSRLVSGLVGPGHVVFPPVTILFAAVAGSGELMAYPELARSVHRMVHHLMLQLLRSFPGSYLVRAQQGDMRYMLAFNSPAAAVGWGLTLQEASLYLPYPQEVLGLSSFGVQLDEGGRLVFRGPRFKMGLAQGSPKVILPDHQGRADYHGSFVNLAARYAAVAAQGGQLVTDADLARQILSMWKVDGGSHDTLGAHGAAGSSSSSSSRAWQHTAPLPASTAAATAAAAAADTSASTPFASSSQALLAKPEPAAAAAAAAVCATAGATATVDVECCWLGSFLFKGNPSPVSMVTFSPAVLSGRHYAPQAVASTKGVRVLQRVGVMDRAVVCLPAAVEGFGPWDALPSSLK